MTNTEKICRDLWSKIVKHRDRWCILCGLTGEFVLEAAHIFNKSQGNWVITYDIDFGVTLCNSKGNDCHQDMPRGSDLFEKVVARIRQVDESRAEKILAQANKPITPCVFPFDPKLVKRILKQQWERVSKDNWMEADIEPGYGDAKG